MAFEKTPLCSKTANCLYSELELVMHNNISLRSLLSSAPAKSYSENNRPAALGAVRDLAKKPRNPINVSELIGYRSISTKFKQ